MNKKITFCINTAKNELDHLKLLFHSMETNFHSKNHEILVFIDSDNQDSFGWLLKQKRVFPNLKIIKNTLPICYGYARNINEMFLLASNEIVSYLQSDMVVCKDYDLEIVKYLKPNMVLCSTRIEPPIHQNSGEKITFDFGLDPKNFNLKLFTDFAEKSKKSLLTEYFFAPFTLYKDVWNNIGGHNTLFRRSREDSDILYRLVLNDVEIKQTWNALVYHFTCTSSRGIGWFDKNNIEAQNRLKLQNIADSLELKNFIRVWGNFKHDFTKKQHYNISAKITGVNNLTLDSFAIIEPFFNSIYIDNIPSNLYELFNDIYLPANNLLNISNDVWEEYKYMYNQIDFNKKIKSFDDSIEDDIILEFNLFNITSKLDYYINSFFIYLNDIISQVEEPGLYSFNHIDIKVNQIRNIAKEKININNPKIKKEHLYSIY